MMIIESTSAVRDIVNNRYRTTLYTSVLDPVTNKKYIEVVQYLYNRVGDVVPTHHNNKVDVKA
jgi:hypothetical protein